MTVTSSLILCNDALRRVGAKTITSLTADSSKEDRLCNQFYDKLRQQLLIRHPWKFAEVHRRLGLVANYDEHDDRYEYDPATISAITAASPPQVTTSAVHGYASGDKVKLIDIDGAGMTELGGINDGQFNITVVDTTKFTLDEVDATNCDAYTSGATVRLQELVSDYSQGYIYGIPSDCLFARHLERLDANYEVVGARLFTVYDDAVLIYTADISTTTLFSVGFTESLTLRLAQELSIPLLGASRKGVEMHDKMETKFLKAYNNATAIDSAQKKQPKNHRESKGDTWLSART
jgi:hypothetical protein